MPRLPSTAEEASEAPRAIERDGDDPGPDRTEGRAWLDKVVYAYEVGGVVPGDFRR